MLDFVLWVLPIAALVGAASPSPGHFIDGGNTRVSAMMMFVGNSEKVYILDKAENNADQINGHPAWGAVWDINTHKVDIMDVKTNVFCASGMHLPNGSYATFGGNGAVTVGGVAMDDKIFQDKDGAKAIRILNPCTSADNFDDPHCQWFDDPNVLYMQRKRWYSAAEPLANGTIVLIGGFVNGGYVNRNFVNSDPRTSGGASGAVVRVFSHMQFMISTSGLNAYAHTYLLSSGLMFVQANLSTSHYHLCPNGVARVYPASGAVAMLPLTPANSDMPEQDYGAFAHPVEDVWLYAASKDCQRITPERPDKSAPAYEQDDNMPDGRTMGQFIILPNGKLLVLMEVVKGTNRTLTYGQMPFGMSLATDPVLRPAIYDPNADKGKRWSTDGLDSAILLPDASVLVAGSNPNVDVNMTTIYPTTYAAEIFYPPYFSATTRPQPSGIPNKLSYGGNAFDIKIPSSSYSGNTIVAVVRPGWTTHGMNMGQRYLQLENSYTVADDGTITLHVAQMPPNPNIFQPGPAMVFVVVNGIPSNATMVIVGSGVLENQPRASAAPLPEKVTSDKAKGSADTSSTNSTGQASSNGGGVSKAVLIGSIVGGVALLAVIGAIIGIIIARRRRAAASKSAASSYAMTGARTGQYEMVRNQNIPYSPSSASFNGSSTALANPVHGQGLSDDFEGYGNRTRT
ncbi:copper radical oxidase variant A [Flagelloscypha sp. PMI_526]|nr:copper radical oxidase variant A [Flagelloscypha sp. PMI_526]